MSIFKRKITIASYGCLPQLNEAPGINQANSPKNFGKGAKRLPLIRTKALLCLIPAKQCLYFLCKKSRNRLNPEFADIIL